MSPIAPSNSSPPAAATASATSYLAPYFPHREGAVPDVYIITFHQHHTLSAHLAFLSSQGYTLNPADLTPLDTGYFACIPPAAVFEAVRRDPGVEFIEDDVVGERDG